MAHEARTGRLPAPLVAEESPAEEVERAFIDLDAGLDRVWRVLTSMRVALVLILAMAVFGLAGTLIVQASPGVLEDPESKAAFLDQVRPKFGGWTNVMDALGLFSVFQSIWFRFIAAALTISTFACSVQRIPGMWRTVTRPRVSVGEAFFDHAPQRGAAILKGSRERALESVQATMGKRRYRVLVEETDGDLRFYADRFRWVPFAGLAGHFAIVIIVLGAMVGGALGYRDNSFVLAEGATRAIPTKPGVTLGLQNFTDSYYADTGAPSDYASDVIVYKDGQEIDRHTVRVNDPLRYEDINLYQSFYGPAAVMKVADESGKALFSEGVPLAWQASEGGSDRAVGSFSVPEKGLTVWVVGTGGPQDLVVRPGQARVEVYQGGETPIDAVSLDPGKPAEIAGLTFTFEREVQFTGLSVGKDPGTPIVWLGCALLFFGFVIRFTIPHRRIWGRIARSPEGRTTVQFAGLSRGDDSLGREIAGLVEELERGQAPRTA